MSLLYLECCRPGLVKVIGGNPCRKVIFSVHACPHAAAHWRNSGTQLRLHGQYTTSALIVRPAFQNDWWVGLDQAQATWPFARLEQEQR